MKLEKLVQGTAGGRKKLNHPRLCRLVFILVTLADRGRRSGTKRPVGGPRRASRLRGRESAVINPDTHCACNVSRFGLAVRR